MIEPTRAEGCLLSQDYWIILGERSRRRECVKGVKEMEGDRGKKKDLFPNVNI